MKLLDKFRLASAVNLDRPCIATVNQVTIKILAASHCYLLDSVVVKKEAFEEAEVVEPLDGLDAVVLQPEALQVSVLLQVLNLRESLQ